MTREAVLDAIRGAQRVTVICHENPDADTLGAALALRIAAERLGKTAEVVAADGVPPFLAGLPRTDEVRRTPGLEPDVAVVVDGPPSRTGGVARDCADWLSRARLVNIDHHVSNDGSEVEAAFVDPEAAATCEMVALLLPDLGVEIDREVATVLAAGIVQDTHTFSHPNATPSTLRVMADLV
jgi:phosphoesterase RecJ-like protein